MRNEVLELLFCNLSNLHGVVAQVNGGLVLEPGSSHVFFLCAEPPQEYRKDPQGNRKYMREAG